MRLIDEEYTRHPFYGTRRMALFLGRQGIITANRKRVQRLMRAMGLWLAWRRGRPRADPTQSTGRTHTCCAA